MNRMRITAGLSLGAFVVLASAKVAVDSVRDQIKAKGEAANTAQKMAVAGSDGWLFFTPELRYLGAGPFWGENAAAASHVSNASAKDPLDPIVDFNDQLSKAGIQLLVVPVPAKAAIYPDKLIDGAAPDANNRIDADQVEFLKVLNAKGVKTLDLGPVFLQYRKDHPEAQPLYCKTDSHWSGQGIAVAADAIGDYVKKQSWYAAAKKGAYKEMKISVAADGDLLSLIDGDKPAQETFNLTSVVSTGAGNPLIESDPASPLLLLGDSHNLIFSAGRDSGMIAQGAGFPENLTSRIKFAPTVEAVMGSGATPARVNLVRKPDELKGKKLVIWLFTAREFTEGQGWKKVPVIKPLALAKAPVSKAAQKFAPSKKKQ